MRRLARKGVVVTLALLGALGLLVGAFRPWVTGAVDDAVLGATRISATGAEVAPGLSAVALAVAAAAIAVVAAGRVTRVVALVGYAVCLATAVGLAVRSLLPRVLVAAAVTIGILASLGGPAAYAVDTAATEHTGSIPSARVMSFSYSKPQPTTPRFHPHPWSPHPPLRNVHPPARNQS